MRMSKLIISLLVVLIIVSSVAIVGTFFVKSSDGDFLNKGDVSITVTGDVMFGRKMPGVLSSGESPYRFVSNVTSNSDILLVNFENPATTSSVAYKGDVPLKCSPEFVNLVKGANITVCALANNHMFDYGPEGLEDTLNVLDSENIPHIGAGDNVEDASRPVVINISNRTITILNYMDSVNFAEYSQEVMPMATSNGSGYSAYNSDLAESQIKSALGNGSDYVIVFMHYGNEYSRSPNEMQVNISHECIDYGADIVLGAHAHVTQGIEMYHGKPIFYNLGNFIFDQSNPNTHRAYFVNIGLVNDSVEVTVYPVNIINYLPHFMSSSDGVGLLEELNPQCDSLNITDEGTGKLFYNISR